MNGSNLIPEPMTHDMLADVLAEWALRVREHDAWEGNIAWQLSDTDAGECEVTAVLRYGNLMHGQGFVRIIGTVPKSQQPTNEQRNPNE